MKDSAGKFFELNKSFLSTLKSNAIPFDLGRSVAFYEVKQLRIKKQGSTFLLSVKVEARHEGRPDKNSNKIVETLEKEFSFKK